MSSVNSSTSNQLELALPIRLVAWHIAEQFEKMPAEVFARSIVLDNPKKTKTAQKKNRWWDKQTTYDVNVAAHVAENLKWWSLSQDEKNIARKLEEKGQSNVAAQKIFRRAFPFHKAFLDGGEKSGLPKTNEKITDLGDMIKVAENKALIVAYLEGLAALPYVSKTCARRLNELAEAAAIAAADEDKWESFDKNEVAEVVRCLLPLE